MQGVGVLRCLQGRELVGLNLPSAKKKSGNSIPGAALRREAEPGCGSSWNVQDPGGPSGRSGGWEGHFLPFSTSSGVTLPPQSFPREIQFGGNAGGVTKNEENETPEHQGSVKEREFCSPAAEKFHFYRFL